VKELTHEQLYHQCDLSQLNVSSTDELNTFDDILGQARALQAIQFGVGMPHDGYNIFALGSQGVGKKTLISRTLRREKKSVAHRTLRDWCYVHNFLVPHQPSKLSFPCGQAHVFKATFGAVMKALDAAIPALVNDADYHVQVNSFFQKLRKKHEDSSEVSHYLSAVVNDVLKNTEDFVRDYGSGKNEYEPCHLKIRYRVNVIVEHEAQSELPVIYEDYPSYHNLIGFFDQTSVMGAVSTDFTLIRPGALHQANGGYLVLDALNLLQSPHAWAALKQALRSKKIRIESLNKVHNLSCNVSIDPEVIPLDIKIILMGERSVYYSIYEEDRDVAELFKVIADCNDTLAWTVENEKNYIQLIVRLIRDNKLLPFSMAAVGRIVEASARCAGSSRKLSVHMGVIQDLLFESNYWAQQNKNKIVDKKHVIEALDQQTFRGNRAKIEYQDEMLHHDILIDVRGERVGTLNALTIVENGGIGFGVPCRITGVTRLGEGEIINIEREIDMSGAIHSKGVSILSAFIGSRFGQQQWLSFSASLVFEQLYNEIDGDSASLAELCVLFSSLALTPFKQSIAITGSVNQHGEVQVIGGVNQKIEGFFDLCQERGLTGEQGVIIPCANVTDLMLHDHLIESVKARQFHIYPVSCVDDALEILSGLVSVAMTENGEYVPDTLHYLIHQRLKKYTEYRHEHGIAGKQSDADDTDSLYP